jgi:hypothetical protein
MDSTLQLLALREIKNYIAQQETHFQLIGLFCNFTFMLPMSIFSSHQLRPLNLTWTSRI